MKKTLRGFAATVGIVSLPLSALQGQNIVVNGGFETGDTFGWNPDRIALRVSDSYRAPEGRFVAYTGQIRSDPAGLWQDLTTVPGQSYFISFFGGTDAGASTANFIRVTFDGATVFDQAVTTTNAPDVFSYRQFELTTGPVSGSTTRLSFQLANDPAGEFLDDVIVTTATTTPEPGSPLLIVTGLAFAGVATSRQRKASAGRTTSQP